MAYRFIFFDTETTGTFTARDRIVEIAAFDPARNKTFEMLVNPGMPIPKEAKAVHGISDEMVREAAPFGVVVSHFFEFCEGEVALVAHNAHSFDEPFLKAEVKRAGMEMPGNLRFVDSLKWARRYRKDLPRHSLQFLRQMYGIQENKAHRALNDVHVLYEVFSALVDDLSCDEICELLSRPDGSEKAKSEAKESVKVVPQKPKDESYLLFR